MTTPITIDYEANNAGNSITVVFNEKQLQDLLAKPSLEIKEQDSLVHSVLIIAAYLSFSQSANLREGKQINFDQSVEKLHEYLPDLKARISHDISQEDFIGLSQQFYKEHVTKWPVTSEAFLVERNINHLMRYSYKDTEKVPSIKRKV